ncbi:MAG: LPS export ABC transporter periplasmic protein LptC [Bacteroidetes bacterium]|nr:LPS export ABC transporter periplasmic protein LptC [Bacteroidota bacterium]
MYLNIPLLFCYCNVLLLFSCKNDLQKVTAVTEQQKFPSETATDVEFLYTDSGILRIKLTAPELLRFAGEEPYNELPKGVHLIFYNDRLTVDSWLSANYAIRFEKKNLMEVRGNVIVINRKGEKLNTEHLLWDEAKKIIYTNEFVKITTADEIIMGYGMEANEDFTRFKVKNIKGTIRLEDPDNGIK